MSLYQILRYLEKSHEAEFELFPHIKPFFVNRRCNFSDALGTHESIFLIDVSILNLKLTMTFFHKSTQTQVWLQQRATEINKSLYTVELQSLNNSIVHHLPLLTLC